jgi:hypothetical protein
MEVRPMESATQERVTQETAAQNRRERAIKRIKDKNDFKTHLVVYLTVNAMLVVIWAFTGAGFFWPIFPIVGWGVGVVMNAYVVYRGNIYSEEQIEREMKNLPE